MDIDSDSGVLDAPPPDAGTRSSDPIEWGSGPAGADGVPVSGDRVVGGVAALVAAGLGVDALWVRIGFVVLALAGGIGLVLYAGLWMALVASPERSSPTLRTLGGVIAVGGVPMAMMIGGIDFVSGPFAVVVLLAGLTLALWRPAQPRSPVPSPLRQAGPRPAGWAEPGSREAVEGSSTRGAWRSSVSAPAPAVVVRPPRPPRSPLGRSTLGLALVVASVGALIDLANGGRSHPEQWLGAAAVVCGLGLLLGALRGHARWLVAPAAVFAGSGYLAGVPASLGIGMSDLTGDRYVYVGPGLSDSTITEEVGFGEIYLSIDGEPDDPVIVDATVGFGDVTISAVDTVSVEVRIDVDSGDALINLDGGDAIGDEAVVRLGPEGPPDVIVDARVGVGDVVVNSYAVVTDGNALEALPAVPGVGDLTSVTDYVSATSDGWFVLLDGDAVIDDSDRVVVGSSFPDEQGGTYIETPVGGFRLLPRSLLLTPTGEIIDLAAVRAELVVEQPGPIVSVPPRPGG